MWTDGAAPWVCRVVEFDGDRLDPERATGPWSGHREFVYDLLRWRQPGTVVELGTHYGVSLYAMCQALRDAEVTSDVHAVDTWAGEEHAGFYGAAVFDLFQKNLDQIHYPHVVLHRRLFADALGSFPDESIDLLHIDGLHTFEALQEDFETWLPKLATNGLVLLHDIDPSSGYGSADYFRDHIRNQYPNRTFVHNFGLGLVLPKGVEGWDFLFSEEWARWADIYRRGAKARDFGRMVGDLTHMVDERDEAIMAQTALIDQRDEAIMAQTAIIDGRDHYIEQLEWDVVSRDAALAQTGRSLRAAESELLRIRDRAEYLEWLDVSPRLQARALSRSLPHAVKKRTRGLRRPRATKRQAGMARSASHAGAVAEESDTRRNLREALVEHFDAGWYAQCYGIEVDSAWDDYLEHGIGLGRAVSSAHQTGIASSPVPWKRGAQPDPEYVLHAGGSRHSGGLVDLVRRTNPRLVTVDLWDTLIVRDRPADAAKLATGRRITEMSRTLPAVSRRDPFDVLAMRVAVERDLAEATSHQEYLIDDVLASMLEQLGLRDPAARAQEVARLREAEIADEIRNSRPVGDAAAQLHANPEWVVLSDFYMSGPDIKRILEGVLGCPVLNPVVSSVDEKASKRLGGMFPLVREAHGVPDPEQHLHIGDNVHSDVAQQLGTGGAAIEVRMQSSYSAPGTLGMDSMPESVEALTRRLNSMPGAEESSPRTAGRRSALLAVAVVERALTEARRGGLDRVHYVSREGLFLMQVHEELEPLLRFGEGTPVRPIHVSASRRSTFGSTIRAPLAPALHRMWTMYGTQSPRAMLMSIGVDPALLVDQLQACGLDMDSPIQNIASDGRVRTFLETGDVVAMISSECERQRQALAAYLQSVTDTQSPWVLVDIGWRGTIQDNLARSMAIPSICGVYFGLFPFLNPQMPHSQKIAVGFDANAGDEFSFAEPPAVLERPWTMDVPSTIGYRVDAGGVSLVQESESGTVSPQIKEFQAGVLEAVPVIAEWLVSFGLTSELLEDQIHQGARDFWRQPSPEVAGIWFDSDHDDTFGALNETTFGKVRPDRSWLAGRFADHRSGGSAASGWSAGYSQWQPVRALDVLMAMGDE